MKQLLSLAGFAILLVAPLLGQALGGIYLMILGGMETDRFLQILQGCTLSFQIIGALIAGYGLFFHKKQGD